MCSLSKCHFNSTSYCIIKVQQASALLAAAVFCLEPSLYFGFVYHLRNDLTCFHFYARRQVHAHRIHVCATVSIDQENCYNYRASRLTLRGDGVCEYNELRRTLLSLSMKCINMHIQMHAHVLYAHIHIYYIIRAHHSKGCAHFLPNSKTCQPLESACVAKSNHLRYPSYCTQYIYSKLNKEKQFLFISQPFSSSCAN